MIKVSDAAKIWNISTRRITMLASQGRIPGAKRIGRCWYLPTDAVKPSDARKSTEQNAPKPKQDRYIFPNILYTICADHPVEALNREEKVLYEAFSYYEAGEFEQSLERVNLLLAESRSVYLRIGCCYLLTLLNLYLRRFSNIQSSLLLFWKECSCAKENKHEISLLMRELEVLLGCKDWLINDFSVNCDSSCSDFILNFLSVISAGRDVLRFGQEHPNYSVELHKLNLLRLEKGHYFNLEMLQNFYLSRMYADLGNPIEELSYLKRAFSIAVEHQLYTTLSSMVYFTPDIVKSLCSGLPLQVKTRIQTLMDWSLDVIQGYVEYLNGNSAYTSLYRKDFALMEYVLREYSFEKIARLEKTTPTKAKKMVSDLFQKFGVKNKKEMVKSYTHFLNHPGIKLPTPDAKDDSEQTPAADQSKTPDETAPDGE